MLKKKVTKKANYAFEYAEVIQEKDKLLVNIIPTSEKKITSITVVSRKQGEEKEFYPVKENSFEIDLTSFLGFNEWEKEWLQEQKMINETNEDETNEEDLKPLLPATNFSMFINVIKENKQLEESVKTVRYRFKATNFREKKFPLKFEKIKNEIDNTFIEPYFTIKGTLAIRKNKEVIYGSQYIRHRHINRVKVDKNKIEIEANVTTRLIEIQSASIILKLRTQELEVEKNLNVELVEEDVNSLLSRYKFNIELLTSQLIGQLLDDSFDKNKENLLNDTIDLFVSIKSSLSEEPFLIRLGKPRVAAKLLMKGETHTSKTGFTYMLSPYFTIKYNNLSFHLNVLPNKNYELLKKTSHFSAIKHYFYKKNDIWVIGERPNTAQDTGYAFFKYIRENYPEKKAYYIIERDSPDINKVENLGNIIYFGTEEHIRLIMKANKIISSHHPTYLYPSQTPSVVKSVRGTKVFIQHGVLGVKNLESLYDKYSSSFDTDLFLVSSEREKRVVVDDMKYNPEEVKITGLSRFDELFNGDTQVKRQLLISPTWREWITNEEKLVNSDYLVKWLEVLNDPKLISLAKKYNFEIVLNLHNNVQPFINEFEGNEYLRIVEPGSIRIQELIKESAVLLTDYSSVAFDFSFLNKPVIYYQFDQKKFLGKKGSHLDLEKELPGPIILEKDSILEEIEKYAKNNFQMDKEYLYRAKKFLKFHDTNSNKRIYEEIKNFTPKRKKISTKIQESYLFNGIQRKFRRSKYYFPTMKKMYKLYQWFIPIKKKRIIFESGVGKQYSDSPKYIYQEMLSKRLDYEYIWVYNGKNKIPGNPKIIERLSPLYYYYLATSEYWINNQNFPFYIQKKKKQTYIQTWHGTPLKKMLHDVESFTGKDEGYKARVSQATAQWDYLISPSRYATERFKTAFKFKKEILEVGYPRNDLFYLPSEEKENLAKNIREKLKIPADKKVILYAPTFRDDQIDKKNKYQFQLELDLQKMYEELSDEYILLMRMHVVISNKIKIPSDYSDFIRNVSSYSDIQELYLISDICITDYSSVMFDFANSKKPLLFYAYDLELYRDTLRGFYMNYTEELPGPIVRTTEEIVKSIRNIKEVEQVYRDQYDEFYNKYCSHETGKAAEIIVKKFFGN